jgi:WD40 repeat protein
MIRDNSPRALPVMPVQPQSRRVENARKPRRSHDHCVGSRFHGRPRRPIHRSFLQGPAAGLADLAVHVRERIATASSDGTARLWHTETSEVLRVFRGHEDWVCSVAFSPNGERIATPFNDGTARLWHVDEGAANGIRDRQIWNLTLARKNSTSSLEGAFSLQSAGLLPAGLRRVGNCILSVAFSPDATRVSATTTEGMAQIWDATTGVELFTLRAHEDWVYASSFSNDGGSKFATASGDRTVKVRSVFSEPEEVLACTDIRLANGELA